MFRWQDLLVDVFEFEFELSLLFVPLSHHLIEVNFDLDHLIVQASQFLVRLPRLLVHDFFLLFFKSINSF